MRQPFYIKSLKAGLRSRLRSPASLLTKYLKPRPSRSSLRFIKNVYSDYRALRTRGPLSITFAKMSEEFARPTSSGLPSQTSTHPTSRRQRLMGFARATRDTYLPRITNSVSLMTSNIGSKSIEYDEFGMLAALPQNTQFTLYPSYTRKVGNKYVVNVRGWMWCPGTMSKKPFGYLVG